MPASRILLLSRILLITQLGLRKAYQYFVEHRQVKNIFEFLGVQHKIKGKNYMGGKWLASSQSHFVIHSTRCTWFASYRDQLARIWMDSCIKAGLRSQA